MKNGEIREENGFFFWWGKDAIQWLIEEGLLWIPTQENFQSWTKYIDESGGWKVESYYSIFQALPLYRCLQSITMSVGLDTIVNWSKEDAITWFETWKPHAERVVSIKRDGFDTTAKLCQALSSRYLPYAQSDGATITVPHPDYFDWDKFRREWDAVDFLKEIGLTVEAIAERWQSISVDITSIDPLDRWQDFVEFFKRSEKERLKGKALLAQTWRTMEKS